MSECELYREDKCNPHLHTQLQAENKKMRLALKSSIEVTEEYEKTMRTMNETGQKFGMKPFTLIPPPVFIKQALKNK